MSANGDRPHAPPTERIEAPLYLARFRDRARVGPTADQADGRDGDREGDGEREGEGLPIYLRRFREREPGPSADSDGAEPLWRRSPLPTQQALTEDNRNKEISPPPAAARRVTSDVYLIRHGETQGYSTDSGLTPQGAWQAHGVGRTLAKRMKSGETIVFRHADTNRARETAEQIHRGLLDGMVQYEKELTIVEPAVADEFRNFGFATPDGLKDVTAAFRQYYALLEEFERTALGDRPLWLVEMDRFWRTQQGGADPIQHWLTTPMLHFEPPSMCVRRFWSGVNRLAAEFPGARLAISTHSGPIRAFAVAALGYDPGEPYNVEHVRLKILESRTGGDRPTRNGTDATVSYRNRVQEIKVPDIGPLPAWSVTEDWPGLPAPEEP